MRGRKRSRSSKNDEGRPVKMAKSNLNSDGGIRPSTSTAKAQKGPFKGLSYDKVIIGDWNQSDFIG